ncbi:unnamed protein product [Lactuca saligna]|uniref:Uncharacterized protein n=1 Tax=Lactuca saligna TaxID=75948 RepID=A0AA36E3F0_LACSI|nr:unnamed protein product [Lactuca saligna]
MKGEYSKLYWLGRIEEAKLLRAQGQYEMAINLAKYISQNRKMNEAAADVFGSAGVIENPMDFARSVGVGIKYFLSVPAKSFMKACLTRSPFELVRCKLTLYYSHWQMNEVFQLKVNGVSFMSIPKSSQIKNAVEVSYFTYRPRGGINQIPVDCTILGDVRLTHFYNVLDVIKKLKEYVEDLKKNIEKIATRGCVSKYVLPDKNFRGNFHALSGCCKYTSGRSRYEQQEQPIT